MAKTRKRRRNPGEDELTYIPGSMLQGIVINEETGQVSAIMSDRAQNPRRRNVKGKAKASRPRKTRKNNAKRKTAKSKSRPRFKNGRFKKSSRR
jgi:hypothetical protein